MNANEFFEGCDKALHNIGGFQMLLFTRWPGPPIDMVWWHQKRNFAIGLDLSEKKAATIIDRNHRSETRSINSANDLLVFVQNSRVIETGALA